MYERVVENWLTKASERSLEVPFCQLLASEGHQIIHITQHGNMEQGKDILTIDQSGVPCAYQIMRFTGKITQTKWHQYINEITQLIEIPIIHPSIPDTPPHVFLVVNGQLSEEVRREISDRNTTWAKRGYPKLEVITKGQLLNGFKKLHTNLWPVELAFEKELLELYLADGKSYLPKSKLAVFLQNTLPLSEELANKSECKRALARACLKNRSGS
jgi:hypothetical protein